MVEDPRWGERDLEIGHRGHLHRPSHRRGLTGRTVRISMPGGDLLMEWRADGHVLMTGPVATAFTGQVDPKALLA